MLTLLGIDVSMKLEIAASQLEALGNPTRLTICQWLVQAGDKGISVGKIWQKLDIPASTLSHHCKRLIDAGLCTQERQGTTLICRANHLSMDVLIGYLVGKCCARGRNRVFLRAQVGHGRRPSTRRGENSV